MTTMSETNQKKQDNRINIESYPQETLLADTIEKRIYLRMADLNLQVETFPAILKRRMVFTRGTDGWAVTFSEGCFGSDHSLMAFPVYLCSLFLKTNPSLFYSDKQKGFDELTPDTEFVPMEEAIINSFCEKYMNVSAISKRLKKTRREKNLTTGKIADELGVSQPSIVNYENPEKRKNFRLTIKQLLQFCDLCHVDPDLIMLGDTFDSVIERTKYGVIEAIGTGTVIRARYTSRMDMLVRSARASVEEIMQSREWIIDNIAKVEPCVMFAIEKMIKNAIQAKNSDMETNDEPLINQTSTIEPDADENEEQPIV